MTGYESKRAAARDKLDDDDDLTIAYQSGYYDGKKAAQPAQKPTTGNILMDSYKAMQSMKVEGPHHVVCQCDRCKQPAQEPVAWLCSPDENGLFDLPTTHKVCKDCFPVYTTPPQRTWVGLEGEEIRYLWQEATKPDRSTMNMVTSFAQAIETKLKEKNT